MLLIIKHINLKVCLKLKITLMVTLQNTQMISRKKLFGRPQQCDSPRSHFPPPSLLSLSLSVCMCHILTPVCRCGPGHRCRCNLSGPILVLGQIFLHVSACSSRVCVCVCVGACEAVACLIEPR